MMKENIEKQREKLHILISQDAEYLDILKASEELDKFITEFIKEKSNNLSVK